MLSKIPKPIYRNPIRMWLGKRYFICRRLFKWYFGKQTFARRIQQKELDFSIFNHKTPLIRKLKNLDLQLQYNKITNLRLAIQKTSGILIQPGETFSFWYLVGHTSKRKGYKEGMMLENGKIVSGVGGGLCQLSNLIFWMLIHTPLTITERWRHSFDVFPDANRIQPFGSGATLSYNYVDLQFKNETDHNYQVILWLSDTHLHGTFKSDQPCEYTYEIEERHHQIIGEPWGGYSRHNQIFRKTYSKNSGFLIKKEPLIENHAILMYRPFLNEPLDSFPDSS